MVVDVCTYNGEKDLWDIHYNVLKDVVDEFIVLEFDKTFSGEQKVFHMINQSVWRQEYPKMTYVPTFEKTYEKYRELAESSPNTQGADHWKLEFMQKESIKDALVHLKDDDTVIIGDVDEILNTNMYPKHILNGYWGPIKVKLDVYTYYLNNRSTEQFWGPIISRWGNIKDKCLNHVRTDTQKGQNETGWHFTSMGGRTSLEKKLTDSYTQESYANKQILENIGYNIENNKDFLGRNFTYTLDESKWPKYLVDQREKYQHLMKPTTSGDITP